jgi:hypothetical protein
MSKNDIIIEAGKFEREQGGAINRNYDAIEVLKRFHAKALPQNYFAIEYNTSRTPSKRSYTFRLSSRTPPTTRSQIAHEIGRKRKVR